MFSLRRKKWGIDIIRSVEDIMILETDTKTVAGAAENQLIRTLLAWLGYQSSWL